MRLVVGGAFQGKFRFAREKLNIQDGWVDGDDCQFSDIYRCRGIQHFHRYVRRALDDHYSLLDLAAKLREKNPDITILTNELGSGVVPVDQFDRIYRDELGRVCEELASEADEVYRVICGIGMVIKKKDAEGKADA